MQHHRVLLRITIGLPLAIFFAWLAFRGVKIIDFYEIRHLQYSWLIAGLIFLFLGYAARTFRWWLMLSRLNPLVTYSSCVTPYMGSFALNNILPLRMGDVVRTVGFCKRLNLPASSIFATMLIERLFDLVGLLLVLALSTLMVSPPFIPSSVILSGIIAAILAMVGAFFLCVIPKKFMGTLLIILSNILPHALLKHMQPIGLKVSESLSLLQGFKSATCTLILSIIAWFLEGTLFWCTAKSLSFGSGLSAWMALGMANLATLIPSTPGHVGTFDFFSVIGFTSGGASIHQAQLSTLAIHMAIWAPITIIGLVLLAFSRSSIPIEGVSSE
jgi:uncharacterized membrane protein YbhN (UPF0104 family)